MKDPNLYVNAQCPTVQDVVNLAMNPRQPFGVAVVPQARICDLNLTPIPLPVPINTHDPSALCTLDAFDDGEYRAGGWVQNIEPEMNTTDDVHHKTAFRLYEFPGIGAFNTLKNVLKVSAQYYRLDTSPPTLMNEVPIAYFLFTIPDRTLLDSGNFWDITGHGLTQIIADIGFENDFTIPKDIVIINAVRGGLMADMLPPDQGGRLPLNSCGYGGNCYGCPEDSGTGTGGGYCQQGYAISDPLSLSLPYGSSTVLRQRGATGFTTPVLYNATIGMKIDASSGAPIDPWSCQPMTVEVVSPGDTGSAVPGEMIPGEMVAGEVGSSSAPFPAFILSRHDTAGNQMYIDTSTGKCYDASIGVEINPLNGNPGTVITPIIFKIAKGAGTGGGDGGSRVAQGNGKGYSPSFGWAVNDTAHALTAQTAPGSQYYLHYVPEAAHNVEYLYIANVTGYKIDAITGHPIDPWNNQQMPYNAGASTSGPSPSWAGDLFLAFEPYSGLAMYFKCDDANFYTWDGTDSVGHLTVVYPSWAGVTPTPPETIFQLAGGDGGASTLPPGAVGPQAGPVGNYTWPDPNNPGLTPSCCPHSGPNIAAYRIVAVPSDQPILDPDQVYKHIKGDPKTRDTLPFTPKDNQLKSWNNLLNTANYWPLYNDSDGNFLMSPLPYIDGYTPQPDPYFAYHTGEDGVIAPGMTQKLLDATAIANKVVVRSENSKRAAITAVAYNRSDRSYLSVQNLGRIIQKQPVIQLDTITDQTVLQLRADVEINFAALPGESIQMDVFLNPFLDVHDVIGLNVWSPDGKTLEITTTDNPFLVSSWKHDFSTRRTTIVLSRLVPI